MVEKKEWKKILLGFVSVSTVLLAACGSGEETTEKIHLVEKVNRRL